MLPWLLMISTALSLPPRNATFNVGGGGYPRGVQLPGSGAMLVCAGMRVYEAAVDAESAKLGPFALVGTVAVDGRPGADLSNCQLLALNASRVLASYRHHLGCAPARGGGTLCASYSLQLAASDDAGHTWQAQHSTIVNGSVGMWEPFLFRQQQQQPQPQPQQQQQQQPPQQQQWEGELRVAYSQEVTNHGNQSIVWQRSPDLGKSWLPLDARGGEGGVISDGSEEGTRDGMPGVAVLADGSVLAVFERGQRLGGRFLFRVMARRSFDGGSTWGGARGVYNASRAGYNAGAPQVVVHRTSSGGGGASKAVVTVSFMTDEDATGAASWVGDASVKVLTARNGGAGGAPLDFVAADRELVRAGPGALWPGLVATENDGWVTFGAGGKAFVLGPL